MHGGGLVGDKETFEREGLLFVIDRLALFDVQGSVSRRHYVDGRVPVRYVSAHHLLDPGLGCTHQ